MRYLVGVLTLCGCLVGVESSAFAQINASQAREMLQSDSPDEVMLALEALGASGGARSVAPIAEKIRAGLAPELLDSAVLALTTLGRAEAGPVLFELMHHRRVGVRVAAIDALIACKPRGAETALIDALSDGDARVRGSAAVGLGQLGSASALDALFHALDRNILEASTAIGQLATADHVERLMGYLGRVPFDALTPAFAEILARREIPERTKLALIGQLEELATPEVKIYLTDLAESLPNGSLQQAAEAASLRIAD